MGLKWSGVHCCWERSQVSCCRGAGAGWYQWVGWCQFLPPAQICPFCALWTLDLSDIDRHACCRACLCKGKLVNKLLINGRRGLGVEQACWPSIHYTAQTRDCEINKPLIDWCSGPLRVPGGVALTWPLLPNVAGESGRWRGRCWDPYGWSPKCLACQGINGFVANPMAMRDSPWTG